MNMMVSWRSRYYFACVYFRLLKVFKVVWTGAKAYSDRRHGCLNGKLADTSYMLAEAEKISRWRQKLNAQVSRSSRKPLASSSSPPFPPPFLSTFWTTRYNGSLLGMPRLRVVFTTLKSKDCYYRVRRESNSQLQSRGIIRGWTAIQEGEELVGFPWEIHLTLLPLYMYTRVELDRRPSVVSSPAHVLFFGSVRPCIPTVYGITDVSNC